MLAIVFALLETLIRPEVRGHVNDLLRCGGYGRLSTECAAFLVVDGERLEWVAWPTAAGFQRAEWNGPLPGGTIVAIVHTHPRREPYPSANDATQAQRLGIPVVAVTPATVAVIQPDGTRAMLIERFGWAEGR